MKSVIYSLNKPDKGGVKPYIPIKLVHPNTGKSLYVNALLDSGADCCTLPSMISRTLGLKLDKEYESEGTTGISGEVLKTYTHTLVVQVYDSGRTRIVRTMKIKVNSLERNDIPPLMGTESFLDQFNVSFNYLKGEIELSW